MNDKNIVYAERPHIWRLQNASVTSHIDCHKTIKPRFTLNVW